MPENQLSEPVYLPAPSVDAEDPPAAPGITLRGLLAELVHRPDGEWIPGAELVRVLADHGTSRYAVSRWLPRTVGMGWAERRIRDTPGAIVYRATEAGRAAAAFHGLTDAR